MRITNDDLDILVEATRATRRKILRENGAGKMMPATVISYTEDRESGASPFGSIHAVVHVDGSAPNSKMEATVLTGRSLLQGDRVMLRFEPPHGVSIVGSIPVGGSLGFGAYPTILVAALDASDAIKRMADYVCDGMKDDLLINGAWNEMWNVSGPGRIQLSEGHFYVFGDEIGSDFGASFIEIPPGCTFAGVGNATVIGFNPDAIAAGHDYSSPLVGMADAPWIPADYGFADLGDFITIQDLRVDGTGCGSQYGVLGESGAHISLRHILATNMEGTNPVFGDDGGTTYLSVEHCVVDVASGLGMDFSDPNVSVRDCVIKDVDFDGVRFKSGAPNCSITGCTLTNVGLVGGASVVSGIEVQGNGCRVQNNQLSGVTNPGASTAHGIQVVSADDVLVTDNQVFSVDGSGIKLRATAGNHSVNDTVTDNTMRLCGLGIEVADANVDTAYIVNNDLRGNTATLTDAGTGTVLLDQANAIEGDNRI